MKIAAATFILVLASGASLSPGYAIGAAPCHDAQPHLVSAEARRVGGFDLQGLHLYESLPDVMARLAREESRFPEHRTEMWHCASDWIEHDRSWREAPPGEIGNEAEQHCVKGLLWQGGQEELSIDFVEDVPSQPGCMVVISISFTKNRAVENKASSEAWEKALLAKYGPRRSFQVIWGDARGPELNKSEYGGTVYLKLKDSDFGDQREKAVSEAIANSKPVDKPKL